MKSFEHYFTTDDKEEIKEHIERVEEETTGEIRVVFESSSEGEDPIQRAIKAFETLDMHKTEDRNGVLIYLAIDTHQTAIVGDKGINEKVDKSYWKEISNKMISFFKRNEFTQGIVNAIDDVGSILQTHFPKTRSDTDELPNEVVEL